MKRFILIFAALSIGILAAAGTTDNGTGTNRSVAHGAESPKYMGSVNAGVAFLGLYFNTSHGVIFPESGLYAGGSLQYNFIYGTSAVDIAAHGKWYYPGEGRVQGYLGLEAGLSVLCPYYSKDAYGNSERNDAEASFVVSPALGLVINFNKVSLDIGAKVRFSPQILMGSSLGYIWAPLPMLGIGLVF